MPRSYLYSSLGLISAPKIRVRSQKYGRLTLKEPVPMPLAGMNTWESAVARELQELRISFRPQASFLGGNILGGGRMDFLLDDYMIDLEVNGPFHNTGEGLVRDLVRNQGPISLGYKLVTIEATDFPTLRQTLLRKIGRPLPGRARQQ